MKYKRLLINTGKIKSLYSVLYEWNEVLHIYLKKSGYEDCHWWHIERAILSSFAAAVWLNDGIALEEYSEEKKIKNQNKKRKQDRTFTGRCDLYFEIGKQGFACEAKKITCGIGGRSKKSNTIDLVKRGLKEACNDARDLLDDSGRRLGMCFAVPRLPKAEIKNKDKPIIEFQEIIKEKIDYSSIAMVFPQKTEDLNTERYHYPGVVLLIKEV